MMLKEAIVKKSELDSSPSLVTLLTSCPVDDAVTIANALIEERLAACVQILPPMQSVYHWDGEVTSDVEQLLWIKSTTALTQRLTERLIQLHPYDTPEVLVLEPSAALAAYARWAHEVTAS